MFTHGWNNSEHSSKPDEAAAKSAGVPVTFNRCGSMFCAYFTGQPVWSLAEAMKSDRARFAKFFTGCWPKAFIWRPHNSKRVLFPRRTVKRTLRRRSARRRKCCADCNLFMLTSDRTVSRVIMAGENENEPRQIIMKANRTMLIAALAVGSLLVWSPALRAGDTNTPLPLRPQALRGRPTSSGHERGPCLTNST